MFPKVVAIIKTKQIQLLASVLSQVVLLTTCYTY